MEWQQIQELLNSLEKDYISLSIVDDYLKNEDNYETENKQINAFLFYFIKSINKKINEIPKSVDEVRNIIIKYGNDVNKILDFLNELKTSINGINKGIEVVKACVEISDKPYEFEDGYENSLSFKSSSYIRSKAAEIYNRDDMTPLEKFKYCDTFEKSLSESEKGELHVQTFIGKVDMVVSNKATMKDMLKVMKGGNPFEKAEKFQQCLMDIGMIAESEQEKASLEENLKWYDNILESDFYKSLHSSKTY